VEVAASQGGEAVLEVVEGSLISLLPEPLEVDLLLQSCCSPLRLQLVGLGLEILFSQQALEVSLVWWVQHCSWTSLMDFVEGKNHSSIQERVTLALLSFSWGREELLSVNPLLLDPDL
jgi:hypothetical protein